MSHLTTTCRELECSIFSNGGSIVRNESERSVCTCTAEPLASVAAVSVEQSSCPWQYRQANQNACKNHVSILPPSVKKRRISQKLFHGKRLLFFLAQFTPVFGVQSFSQANPSCSILPALVYWRETILF